ncbi:endoglycosidase [Capnocytophaga sp.]|uniref:endoglycosidase n=1 Tax=Capnocytophaga sp. TaxID=44737 RepID=UPI0026DC387A|nr:endoglycosidase [Capnocytophaga sp.]MDO5105973.1 endoglycosidase [Capnocytophaga sp.]
MKKNIINLILLLLIGVNTVGCVKNEPLDLEKDVTKQLSEEAKEKESEEKKLQDQATAEEQKAWDAYYKMLRDYKQKAWKGEKPFVYYFYSGWSAVDGIDKTWLQALPDTLTAVSIWGGFGKEPDELTKNQVYDIQMFRQKGGSVFTCYQVSNVGLGLPGGLDAFTKKYGRDRAAEQETERVKIYARDLARHIIALDFDGFDIDWEPTVGDHRGGYAEFAGRGAYNTNGYHANMITFIKELGKYFGTKYTGEERKKHLRNLFDENFAGYHPGEKDFIAKYKPYFEKHNAVDKKFYLLFDGEFFTMTEEMDSYFDKYVMQDYGRADELGHYLRAQNAGSQPPSYYPPVTKASSTAEFEKGHFTDLIRKAKVYKKNNGGVSAYKGELDIATNVDDITFVNYLRNNNIKGRKYTRFAWTREAIRIMDPRSPEDYKDFKEQFIIRKP